MSYTELSEKIVDKFKALEVNPEIYLKGILEQKPITYWEYIQLETLMTLQNTRTDHADETIFVIYHQITELTLKLIVHELKQATGVNELKFDKLKEKIQRVNRYTEMLINSFGIMKYGMDYDSYNIFRNALAPASGFQSVQFRYIELYCTAIQNLVNAKGKERLSSNPSFEEYFDNLYWKDAGIDRQTGKKTLTLKQFEDKYLADLIAFAKEIKGNTVFDKVLKLTETEQSDPVFKNFDYLYNYAWPLVHLETAQHYLDSKGENKDATGGSEWKKYLHPNHQQRVFFPYLWTGEKLEDYKLTL